MTFSKRLRPSFKAFLFSPLMGPLPLLPFYNVEHTPWYVLNQHFSALPVMAVLIVEGIVLGYLMEMLVGLPVYTILRKVKLLSRIWCILTAGIIGLITPLVLFVVCTGDFRFDFLRPVSIMLGAACGASAGFLFSALMFAEEKGGP